MSFSKGNKVKYSKLREENGASSFKCEEIGSTNNGKLPSQALNPIENVSAIMLRSRKELKEKRLKKIKMEEEEEIETELSTKNEHPPPL